MKAGNGFCLELGKYQSRVDNRLKQLEDESFGPRLWNKEERLWINPATQQAYAEICLGWLYVIGRMKGALSEIEEFRKEIVQSGFEHVVLLGMGGSSLAPFVMQQTFQSQLSDIQLIVLDSTDPETIKKIDKELDIRKTLFIVASKSGSTAEVMAFYNYFYYRVNGLKGDEAGRNFVAITDEGSPLAELARRKKFRRTFINFPDIGGRYSALSYFGMVPASLAGVDIRGLLNRTEDMMRECGPQVPANENPGIILGTVLAELSMAGVDKLTYLLPPELSTFGTWLEQLIAESTGKDGKGILPLNGHPFTDTEMYSRDRIFLQYGIAGQQDDIRSMQRENIVSGDFPLISIRIKDALDLGKEFFRWEIATATAGSILGLNPFDQPNVEESKQLTNELLRKAEINGNLPKTEPTLSESSLDYFASYPSVSAHELLSRFLVTAQDNDYITLQAYLPEGRETERLLSEVQLALQVRTNLAVSTQFGPRYLHSTGQYHKGGPNNGIFIQFISNSKVDIQIPEKAYTFGMLERAQAFGDREALTRKGRRVLLIDLGDNIHKGLSTFRKLITTIKFQKPVQKGMRQRIRRSKQVLALSNKKSSKTLVATMVVRKKK